MTSESGREVVDVIPAVDLYASDGDRIGHVDELNPDFVIVSDSDYFGDGTYIPRSAVSRSDENGVYLNVARDQLESQGWGTDPSAYGDSYSTDSTLLEQREQSGRADAWTETGTQDDQRIERVEEDLRATKSVRQAGEVRVTKDVVEEEKRMSVPVSKEQVEIRSRSVDRPAGGSDFQGGTISVPLKEETVDVQKEARVVEEIELDKQAVQGTVDVGDTVRKERVNIEQTGDVEVERRNG